MSTNPKISFLTFPISKAQLKHGYIIKAELDEKNKQAYFDSYTKKAIDDITLQIIAKSPSALHEAGDASCLSLSYFFKPKKNEKFKTLLDELNFLIYHDSPTLYYTQLTITEAELDTIKDNIRKGLLERFPDTLIQLDPLKTYLYISWIC
jgi:hypothetical protein